MNLNLYQIWYDDNSKPDANSLIKAYDCRDNPEFLKREVAHLIRFYDEIVSTADDDDYFALLSPKFKQKTGLSFEQVHAFILDHPLYDVYLFNPFPTLVYVDLNVWDNGESRHPNLKRLTQKLFDTAQVGFDLETLYRNNINTTVYCNYWVATKKFLDAFVPFIKRLDTTIDNMPQAAKEQYFANTRYNTEASFYPFIFERLISTFLVMHQSYTTKPYVYDYPFLGNHKMTPLEEKFYYSEDRVYFDKWEISHDDIDLIYRGFKVIQSRLKPNVNISNNRAVNRLSNSALKRIYRVSPFNYVQQLKAIDDAYNQSTLKEL